MNNIDELTGFSHWELNGKRIDYSKKSKPSYAELEGENAKLYTLLHRWEAFNEYAEIDMSLEADTRAALERTE
jgi:hypothetical protein